MTISTPDKKIVSISGKPIKSQITTTKDGKKVSGDEAIAKLATQLPVTGSAGLAASSVGISLFTFLTPNTSNICLFNSGKSYI